MQKIQSNKRGTGALTEVTIRFLSTHHWFCMKRYTQILRRCVQYIISHAMGGTLMRHFLSP